MAEFKQLKTSFRIPKKLQEDIDALEEGVRNEVSYVDCLQDEIRSMAHGITSIGLNVQETYKQMVSDHKKAFFKNMC